MKNKDFIIVGNSDGSVITCPRECFTKEPWLFTKKKVILMAFTLTDATDSRQNKVAHDIHNIYVSLSNVEQIRLEQKFPYNWVNVLNAQFDWSFDKASLDLKPKM